jgi:hypothetical protein
MEEKNWKTQITTGLSIGNGWGDGVVHKESGAGGIEAAE